MRVARVFPRRTKATPDDELAFCGYPGLFPPEVDEVHVSVAFTWDLNHAEHLADQWKFIAPVTIGGPAAGTRGEGFVPGMYLKPGYVITSRGCPNRCWFCHVWKNEGPVVRELPITEGWNVLDDNLLACSDEHIRAVFAMLKRQHHPVEFTGGLEAARLEPWHVELLAQLKPKQVFFAYDTPDDLEPLRAASRLMLDAGFTEASHSLRCYCLIGYPRDTLEAATERLNQIMELGMCPMAMLWRSKTGIPEPTWRSFKRMAMIRRWSRPAIIHGRQHGESNPDQTTG